MDVSWDEMKSALREVLEEEMGIGRYHIAPRWDGGKMIIKPFDTSQQSKEVPLSMFFKKIISVREKLRVIEQKLNNHPNLTMEDKAELQQLITRAYGSLTTFNFLFRDDKDRFIGMKGAD